MGRFRFQLLRRFFRYAFHVAAVLSALALVACLVLWPWSHYDPGWRGYGFNTRSVDVGIAAGRLLVQRAENSARSGPGWHGSDDIFLAADEHWSYLSWESTGGLELGIDGWAAGHSCFLGVSSYTLTLLFGPGSPTYILHEIPFSYLTLLSALLPALWLRAWRKRRRMRRARGFPVGPPSPSETRPSGSVAADSPSPAR